MIMTTQDGTPLSDQTLIAVARFAARQAEFTARVLDGIVEQHLDASESLRLSPAFLLEFSAVLRLGLWERQGLLVHVEAGLPSYDQAAAELAARAEKEPEGFSDPSAAPLSQAVLRLWTERFAWEGPEHLQAEVLLGDIEEDDLVDVMAEFLWTHRGELNHLPPESEENE